MSISKLLAAAAVSILLAIPCRAQSSIVSALTNSNGIAAGKALLSLYTQYKADGKLDLSNANNISNLVSLASNIKGLADGSGNSNFLSGLISGSQSLVNNSNSNNVLNTLTSISGLDASSIASSVATSTAKNLLGKLGSKASGSSSTSSAASTMASSLTSLFSKL